VRVSPLCIGAMSVGDQWKGFMGNGMNYDEAEKFLDSYYDMGGNVSESSTAKRVLTHSSSILPTTTRVIQFAIVG